MNKTIEEVKNEELTKMMAKLEKQCTSPSVISDLDRLYRAAEGFTMSKILSSEYETAIDRIFERIPKNLQGKTGGHGRKSKNRRNKIVFKKRRTRRRRRKF